MSWKIIFGGVGGQGVITAAILLGEAVVVDEGRYAVQTQTYGAQARGGLTRADLTISDHETYYPRVNQAHILVCLHQQAYTAYLRMVRPGGVLIADKEHVKIGKNVDARTHSLPLAETVMNELGSWRTANMCMLGAVVHVSRSVRPESVRAAIARRFGPGSTNETAFDLGLGLIDPPPTS